MEDDRPKKLWDQLCACPELGIGEVCPSLASML
jgi:hypothetical protein